MNSAQENADRWRSGGFVIGAAANGEGGVGVAGVNLDDHRPGARQRSSTRSASAPAATCCARANTDSTESASSSPASRPRQGEHEVVTLDMSLRGLAQGLRLLQGPRCCRSQ